MSHTHYTTSHSPSYISSIILIISDGRYNLWCYTLYSYLQFPITFSHKSIRTDQHCSQTQSTVFSQCHKPSVTPTAIKLLSKHTNFYTSITSSQKGEGRAKHYEAAVCISPILFPLNFFILQSSFLIATPKYFKLTTLPKFQTMYQLGHFFYGVISPLYLQNTQLREES